MGRIYCDLWVRVTDCYYWKAVEQWKLRPERSYSESWNKNPHVWISSVQCSACLVGLKDALPPLHLHPHFIILRILILLPPKPQAIGILDEVFCGSVLFILF